MAYPPEWIANLVNCVLSGIQPAELLSPVGCHYHFNTDTRQWEISVFVSDTRVIGGQYDGAQVRPAFFLDLNEVIQCFDEISSVTWQTAELGDGDELGPHVSLEGEVFRNNVWLRLLARAPRHIEAGREVSVYSNSIADLW